MVDILRHYATKNQGTASQESFIMQITCVSHELTVYVMGDMGHADMTPGLRSCVWGTEAAATHARE